MATIPEAYAMAVQHHQAGQLEAAQQICEQILAAWPDHADALHLLGIAASQSGNNERAAGYMRRAIALNGSDSTFHSNLGTVLKELGQLDQAVACCLRALELQPDSAAAHYNLGNVLMAQKKVEEAIVHFRQAFELKPDFVAACNNLGNAYLVQKKFSDAAWCFRRALELKPAYAEALNNLGAALKELGQTEEAVAHFRQAIAINQNLTDAFYNLGTTLQLQGKLDESLAAYRRVIELKPGYADAYGNLGIALNNLRQHEEAVACLVHAVQLKPDDPVICYNFGTVLLDQGRLTEAAAMFREALRLNPDYAAAYNNLGKTLNDQGKLYEAEAAYQRSIDLDPLPAMPHSNLAYTHQQFRKLKDAEAGYERALQLDPNCADARFGRSSLWLLQGDFERGWPEYEWRWKAKQMLGRDFPQPRWGGEPLARRTILLHAEQGFGDTIQAVRYATLVKQQNPAATVFLECQPQLAKLLAPTEGIDRLLARGEELPRFDVHAPLLSLPGIVKTSLETIPGEIPYVYPDTSLVQQWRKRLEPLPRPWIGLNWRGRASTWQRDVPLDCLKMLTDVPGVSFINLQKDATREELTAVSKSGQAVVDLGPEFDTSNGPFMDTAAVMMNLDLVISSDTVIPHLAGALGVPVWLAVPFVPDWRWLLDRDDSPWYRTMRLFRQKAACDWSGIFEDIRAELISFQQTKV
jgi:tetratricopeptide (TPR) repeat protein